MATRSAPEIICLKSNDRFVEVGYLDVRTGTLVVSTREDASKRGFKGFGGAFSREVDPAMLLYREGGLLVLRVGDETVPLHDGSDVEHRGGRDVVRRLRVGSPDGAAWEFAYRVSRERDADDPTPFAEHEDFDFGLFASNVWNDVGRRDRLLDLWGKAKAGA